MWVSLRACVERAQLLGRGESAKRVTRKHDPVREGASLHETKLEMVKGRGIESAHRVRQSVNAKSP